MIKGILGKPYLDLSTIVDVSEFDLLHPEICRGFALGKHLAALGSIDVPDGFMNLDVYNNQFKPLYKAHKELLNLPDSDLLKLNIEDFSENELSTYLKFSLGAYDLYSFYVIYDFEDGWREDTDIRGRKPAADYFPGVIAWIENLIEQKIFSHIGRATFFVQEAGGISFEHHDPSVDPENPNITSEFIHFRPSLDRPFYVRDSTTLEKTYINTRVGYWNDQDLHGGDPILIPSYSFRIDGKFTEQFKEKMSYTFIK